MIFQISFGFSGAGKAGRIVFVLGLMGLASFPARGGDDSCHHPFRFRFRAGTHRHLWSPSPSRDYSVEEHHQNPYSGKTALITETPDSYFIFIDKGKIFSKFLQTGELSYISGPSNIASVFIMADTLAAVKDNGSVYLLMNEPFHEIPLGVGAILRVNKGNNWVKIMSCADKVLSTCNDFVALKGDILYRYRGRFSVRYLSKADADSLKIFPVTFLHPVSDDGKTHTFTRTEMNGVADITPVGGHDIKITYKDGSQVNYNDLLKKRGFFKDKEVGLLTSLLDRLN